VSTVLAAPELRLHTVPWEGLARPGPLLAGALEQVLSGRPAERVLDGFLRAHRDLSATERQATAEAVFGVALWRRRLAWHAGGPAPAALLFVLLRDLGAVPEHLARAWSGLGSAPIPPSRPPPDEPALRFSFPDWLYDILVREVGADDAPLLAASLNLPGPITFRANTLRSSRDALQARLADEGVTTTPGTLTSTALHVSSPERPNVFGLPAWRSGAFEVQDEGSQLLGALVEGQPGEVLLDFCAGSGGKSLQLAAQLQNEGAVHAWDIDQPRLERLRARSLRAGATCIRLHRVKPPASLLAERVLVDAPCSELGALRRGPDLRFRLDPAALATFPPLQLELLTDAVRHLRPGGRLVYATCSLRSEENEQVALAFEGAHPHFTRALPPWVPEAVRTEQGFLRTFPHRHGTDGFFAAVWTLAP
jgi:16S rRNA (cytosine967-C5)-methyltransferase